MNSGQFLQWPHVGKRQFSRGPFRVLELLLDNERSVTDVVNLGRQG